MFTLVLEDHAFHLTLFKHSLLFLMEVYDLLLFGFSAAFTCTVHPSSFLLSQHLLILIVNSVVIIINLITRPVCVVPQRLLLLRVEIAVFNLNILAFERL